MMTENKKMAGNILSAPGAVQDIPAILINGTARCPVKRFMKLLLLEHQLLSFL
jgi:hypothetical protein